MIYFAVFSALQMAKGKHAPAKGAVRPDKVIHPKSRKAMKIQSKEQRKFKFATQAKTGGQKLQATGDKMVWFKENLALCEEREVCGAASKATMLALAEACLTRFEEEIEQINLKDSVGDQRGKRRQHAPRLDLIRHTIEREREEFEGCGLEMPDLLDNDTARRFREWEGELKTVQNIKMRRVSKKSLLATAKNANTADTMES